MMYGSLSTEQADPLLKNKKSNPRNRLAGAAQAVRATHRLEKSRRQKVSKKKQEGVFGSIFPKDHQAKKTTSPSPETKPFVSTTATTTTRHPHSWVYTLLNPRSQQWQALLFKRFLSIVIICDMVMFILSTEPRLKDYQHLFYIAEGTSSTIFLIEYIARLVTITESHKYNKPIMGRLRYMMTSSSIIDALATFPFFVELLTSLALPRLTYLRFFRLLRILRTSSFSKAADTCIRVIYYNREILHVAMMLGVYLILFTAVALYYFRPKDDHGEFTSIGATMYMSTLMLTGQGGPEGADLPWYTKAIVLMTGVFSIGMFAIPASMLTWGFEAEAQRVAAKARRRTKHNEYSSTSSSSSGDSESDVSTSDEEYLKIIAGDDEDENELLEGKSATEQAALQELLDRFHKADADESGSLTKREFLKIAEGLSSASLLQPPASDSASLVPLISRMEQLEKKVDATNSRLDRLVQLLEQVGEK